MANIRFKIVRRACLSVLAVGAFVAGFSASAGSTTCSSRCEQRFQACLSNGMLSPDACERNYVGCLSICYI